MKTIIYSLAVLVTISCANEKTAAYQKDKVLRISSYLDSLDGFSGVVLIAKNDSILLKKSYGYAHLGHKVKNTTATRFSYASIGKSFTAVAILQLVQQGKLSLDDTIGKFIPDYPDDLARDSVTIRLLLTHRSGLPNYFASDRLRNTPKDQLRTLNDLAPLYENQPMESKPGEVFAYRNTNYVVLGRIIETVTNMSYDDYLKKNIFSVAQMDNTGLFDIDHPIENAAEGYTLSDIHPGKFQKTLFMSTVKGSPAGGGYTTVDDLYNFVMALENSKLLSLAYTQQMKTQKSDDDWYGFGVQFPSTIDSKMYGHSGGHFGVGSEWRVYGKQGYVVIILTNKDADQGFLDARFFTQKTLASSTSSIDSYFFTKKIQKVCIEKGFEYARKRLDTSSGQLSERDLNGKGYELIKRGEYLQAIEVFKLLVYAFPESYNAYDSLGEAYMKNGNIQLALRNYQKSLELNPENYNARERIEKLKKS